MSLTDKIKNTLIAGVTALSLAGPAYGQNLSAQQEFEQALSDGIGQYSLADCAFRYGVKKGNQYHIQFRNLQKGDEYIVDFYDLDGNGVDQGDKLSAQVKLGNESAKTSIIINTAIKSSDLAGLRSYFDDKRNIKILVGNVNN